MKRELKVNYKIWEAINKPQPIIVIIGGRGCVSPDTLIDTPSGQVRVDQFDGGEVYALTDDGIAVVYAEKPIRYPPERLYKVTFSDGATLSCTDQHRFLTEDGWKPLSVVHSERLEICAASLPRSSLEPYPQGSCSDVRRCFQTLAGFLYCYFWYCHQCGLPLHEAPKTYLDVFRQLAGERQRRSHSETRKDDLGFWSTRNPSQFLRLLSSLASLLEEEAQSCEGSESCNIEKLSALISGLHSASRQFRERSNPELLVQQFCELFLDFDTWEKYQEQSLQTIVELLQRGVDDTTYSDSIRCNGGTHYISVVSCVETSVSEYFDFFVPIYNNYLSNGIVNHNSGKSIGVGDVLTFEMDTKGYDVYCLREFQESIGDSVHRVFESSIKERLQLPGWEVQQNTVIAPNGAKTTYKGANRNPDAMQSAQGYLRSWFEEAHRASEASLDKLLPTILRNPGAKCIFTANPQSSGDAFSKRFIVPYQSQLEKHGFYEDALHYVVIVNWRDNPWWNEEQEALRKWDHENLPRAKYDWVWEGKFLDTIDNAIIDAEWFDACVDAHKKLGFSAQGQERVAYDPADTGDAKAVAYIHGVVVKQVKSNETGTVDTATDWACDFAHSIKPDSFTWDADGMGAGLKRQIMDAFKGKKIHVEAFHGSHGADYPDSRYQPLDGDSKTAKTNRETFFNARAQYYWMLRDRIFKTWQAVTKNKYINPDELISFSSEIEELQGLRSELCRIPRKFNGAGRIQLMSKPDMKKEGIDSPNMADAVMMLMRQPKIETPIELMEFASEW